MKRKILLAIEARLIRLQVDLLARRARLKGGEPYGEFNRQCEEVALAWKELKLELGRELYRIIL
jgi:hypothetical protein